MVVPQGAVVAFQKEKRGPLYEKWRVNPSLEHPSPPRIITTKSSIITPTKTPITSADRTMMENSFHHHHQKRRRKRYYFKASQRISMGVIPEILPGACLLPSPGRITAGPNYMGGWWI